ncbi:MAG: arsenate reductase (glutaredoxin) [Planctomycetota bacterium]|jgi:arsenate reductase|nr:arsenate reductase (glutaredoxin) [Planctomycetota bacterium]MDP6761512.1 arsenate reductase (glutaredoxin) [Planctomycetota bacterium]MDP6989495.1 arsenate reductase (glutaredoxin) [Planctomycetota bacterium]
MSETAATLCLLHNPRCSKSRAALALLEERGVAVEVRPYLERPLDAAELARLADRLGSPVGEWVRRKQPEFAAAGLGPDSDEAELYAALEAHPILMERPIAVVGERARIGRPPERILELLDGGGDAQVGPPASESS